VDLAFRSTACLSGALERTDLLRGNPAAAKPAGQRRSHGEEGAAVAEGYTG
jgi:hypothetical protein